VTQFKTLQGGGGGGSLPHSHFLFDSLAARREFDKFIETSLQFIKNTANYTPLLQTNPHIIQ
jgi:hypothetical protein